MSKPPPQPTPNFDGPEEDSVCRVLQLDEGPAAEHTIDSVDGLAEMQAAALDITVGQQSGTQPDKDAGPQRSDTEPPSPTVSATSRISAAAARTEAWEDIAGPDEVSEITEASSSEETEEPDKKCMKPSFKGEKYEDFLWRCTPTLIRKDKWTREVVAQLQEEAQLAYGSICPWSTQSHSAALKKIMVISAFDGIGTLRLSLPEDADVVACDWGA